jgi:predicted alpha/beta-fold hydrolase
MGRVAQTEFRLLNSQYRNVPPLTERIGKLAGIPQLYLETSDDPVLGASTRDIFQASAQPHELDRLAKGNYAGMLDDEKHNYENRIVSFFLTNLPAIADGSSRK